MSFKLLHTLEKPCPVSLIVCSGQLSKICHQLAYLKIPLISRRILSWSTGGNVSIGLGTSGFAERRSGCFEAVRLSLDLLTGGVGVGVGVEPKTDIRVRYRTSFLIDFLSIGTSMIV